MLKELIQDFYSFAKNHLGFKGNCKVILKKDCENGKNPLGKTGYYDPENKTITIFTSGRHPKDCVRSFAHEIWHFWQDCNGKFSNVSIIESDPKYAQNNKYLREMEKEAYMNGNILFRDWEDNKKYDKNEKLYEKLLKECVK